MSRKALVDCIITVCGEKISGLGEDSAAAAYSEPLGIIGVFDGCGGIGAQKYPSKDNRSGAYLASREAKAATENWFAHIEDFDKTSLDELSKSLKERLVAEMSGFCEEQSGVKGSLVREFPTTLSAVLFKELKKTVLAAYFWAGDSRGYIQERGGLIQLTRDDIAGGGDAYLNLREDARLLNFVSADGDFSIRQRIAEITPPAMLICATDGCFGYFKTPMEFEYLLLQTLDKSESFAEWKTRLTKEICAVSGDDFSMHICVLGCGGISGAKKVFKKRKNCLKKEYIKKIASADEEKLEKLWKDYKEEYYG